MIDATTRTVLLADATRYTTFLLLPLSSLACAVVSNSFCVSVDIITGDEQRERDPVFLLGLALGPHGAPIGADAVPHGGHFFEGLVELFVLRAFASSVAVVGVEGGPEGVVLGLGVDLGRWRAGRGLAGGRRGTSSGASGLLRGRWGTHGGHVGHR